MTTPNMGSGSSPGIGHPDDPMTQIALQGIVRAGAPAAPAIAAAPQIAASMNKGNVVPMTLQWAGTPPGATQVGGGLYSAQELGRMDPQSRFESMTQIDPSLLDAQARRSAGDAIVAGMAHNQAAHLWDPGAGTVPPVKSPTGIGAPPMPALLWYALGPFLKGMKARTAEDRRDTARFHAGDSPEEQARQMGLVKRRQDEFYSIGTGHVADKRTRAAMKEAGEPTRINLQQYPPTFGPSQRYAQPYGREADEIHDFPITVKVGDRDLHIGAFSRTINRINNPHPSAGLPQGGAYYGPASWHFWPAPNVLIEKNFDPQVLRPKFVDWLRANNFEGYAMEFAARPPREWYMR